MVFYIKLANQGVCNGLQFEGGHFFVVTDGMDMLPSLGDRRWGVSCS